MKRPRLNVLRTFEVAGRRLSFSLAAEELNITQAAVSQQIRQLEAYLETPLFIRHHRRLSLTSTARAYLSGVHEAIDRLDTITDQLFPDRPHQTVTLHCTSSIAALWLAPKLGEFKKRHPEIDLRIRTLGQDHGEHSSSGADMEIIILNHDAVNPGTKKLLRATITPVCSPKMFSEQTRPKTPADILAFELIHVTGYDDDWHRWFRRHQLHDKAIPRGLSVDGSLIAIEAVLKGEGIMLGRRPFIDSHIASAELVEVFAQPFHLHADYVLRHSAKGKNRHAGKTVAKWLTGLADQRLSSAYLI